MKVCNMCGSQLQDNYNACPNCGNTNLTMQTQMQQPMGQPYPQQPMQQGYQQMPGQMPGPYVQQPQQKGNIAWGILGFFIPIVGWILWGCWKNTKPGDAKMAGIGGLIGFFFNLIVLMS